MSDAANQQLQTDNDGSSLAFIVGAPRSGTTWLQRLLAAHPQVRTGQESEVFMYVGPQLRKWREQIDPARSGRNGVGLACYFRESEFMIIVRDYLARLMEPMIGDLSGGEIFLEKTPSHALFVGEIAELLPKSHIVHVIRDARDVVASLLAASQSWGKGWAPRDARSAAGMWIRHVEAARDAGMRLPKDQYLEVHYEDLNHDTAGTLAAITHFIGLEWDEASLRRAVEANDAENARRMGGTPIPLGGEFGFQPGSIVKEPPGFVRRAEPGGWKRDLSTLEKLQVWVVARHMMAQLGYPWSSPWSA